MVLHSRGCGRVARRRFKRIGPPGRAFGSREAHFSCSLSGLPGGRRSRNPFFVPCVAFRPGPRASGRPFPIFRRARVHVQHNCSGFALQMPFPRPRPMVPLGMERYGLSYGNDGTEYETDGIIRISQLNRMNRPAATPEASCGSTRYSDRTYRPTAPGTSQPAHRCG